MIGIRNTGKQTESGHHVYELFIYDGEDKNVIAHFLHRREDGLAVCLRQAAGAVDIKSTVDKKVEGLQIEKERLRKRGILRFPKRWKKG